jgi:hypothetical protein
MQHTFTKHDTHHELIPSQQAASNHDAVVKTSARAAASVALSVLVSASVGAVQVESS